MYSRKLAIQLHQNDVGEFTRVVESQVIPLLRKQSGFRDEQVLINPTASQAVTDHMFLAPFGWGGCAKEYFPQAER